MKGVEVLCAMSCAYYMLGSLSLSLPLATEMWKAHDTAAAP